MFDLIGYLGLGWLIKSNPGITMIVAGVVLLILIIWKDRQQSTSWRWSPKQVFDVGLGLIVMWLIGYGSYIHIYG